MVSGHSERERVVEARDAGITEFVVKPVSASGLLLRIISAFDQSRDFIVSDVFVGPDRRRRRAGYEGPDRRGSREGDEPADPNTEDTGHDGR